MLAFPNCKINLGLNITSKRQDGFHNIESVFYPVNWCDALEIIPVREQENPFLFSTSGIQIEGKTEDNLIYKAWKLLSQIKTLPPINVHLHKNLPMGAGIGGGSSDAAYFINMADQQFNLNCSEDQKMEIAAKLGSDCSFFINNKPVLAYGKGNEFLNVNIDLSSYFILLVYPNIHSSTKEAYAGIVPKPSQYDLAKIIGNIPVQDWKNYLFNAFEKTMFIKYPKIKKLKEDLYTAGALYSSMSGSGSSVFGIFDKKPVTGFDSSYLFYLQTPALKIL